VNGEAAKSPWLGAALKALFAITMFAAAAWTILHVLQQSTPEEIGQAFLRTPSWAIAAALITTVLSYLSLTASEWWALRTIGKRLPMSRIALITVISYTATNALGFSIATGAVTRFRLYPKCGLSSVEIGAVMVLGGTAVTLSGIVTAGAAILLTPNLPVWLYALGVALLAPAALWLVKLPRKAPFLKHPIETPPLTQRLLAFIGCILDWVFSGFALFVLFPDPSLETFAPFMATFILGSVVSAASGVPGGIGVFEAVMLTIGASFAPTAESAAALLLYRLLYAIGPFSLVAITFASYEMLNRRKLGDGERVV
jgi:phosphatidylglycerol lysyltransferase